LCGLGAGRPKTCSGRARRGGLAKISVEQPQGHSAEEAVKVQQRGSGGCWRTLTGLAEFALVESYLSTAAKWGISKLDALRDLSNGNAWMPPGLEPAG
jgi:hypothetical protein